MYFMVIDHPDYTDRGILVSEFSSRTAEEAVYTIVGKPAGEDSNKAYPVLTRGQQVYIPALGSTIDNTWQNVILYRMIR